MKALLVIDVQNGVYSEEGREVFDGEAMIAGVNRLIASARACGCPVVFVQHQDEWLLADSPEWQLMSGLDARPETDLFVRKTRGSAFHDTPLKVTLERLGVDEVVLCGLQTEFCVDSTFRHAVGLGFKVVLAEDAHSTLDTPTLSAQRIVAHHNRTLAGYGRVVPAESVSFEADPGSGHSGKP